MDTKVPSPAPGSLKSGRPTDPAVHVAEALVEALAALDEDRRLIAFARSTVRDLYRELEARDQRIVLARTEIHAGYVAAETIVTTRGAGRVGANRRYRIRQRDAA